MSDSQEETKLPYSTFVKDQNDLRGFIAYSLYKASKIEFEINLDEQNLSPQTYKKKVEDWKQSQLLPSKVSNYNDCADSYLADYLNKNVNKYPWIRNIISGAISSIAVTILAIIISVSIAIYKKFNPIDLLKKAANDSITTLISTDYEPKTDYSLETINNKIFLKRNNDINNLYCPSCYLQLDANNNFCPHCGISLTK